MREKDFLPVLAEKFGITEVNDMQRRMMEKCGSCHDIILLSPTGTGKTLAYVLPVIKLLKPPSGRVQCTVIAPGRELVVQIASIFQQIAAGYKVTALYGGHNVEDETNSLSVTPDIIVATPGRLLDHAVRNNIYLSPVRIVVLDEFDKSLELGFANEMERIIKRMKNVSHTYLVSATPIGTIPGFISVTDPLILDYRADGGKKPKLTVHRIDSEEADKLTTLRKLLFSLAGSDGRLRRTIVFVNYRESAIRCAKWLNRNGVECGVYHGELDQMDREKAVAMFNNGTTPVLVATDLAARGLDIADVENIIHYHQPPTPESFTHRNGRTARADASGDVYVIIGPGEDVKDWVHIDDTRGIALKKCEEITGKNITIYFSAGKKEKLSKGDILGFLTKQCSIEAGDVGKINVADRYSLAAVPRAAAANVVTVANTTKIKGKKIRAAIARQADCD